jgi:hypothetical protein
MVSDRVKLKDNTNVHCDGVFIPPGSEGTIVHENLTPYACYPFRVDFDDYPMLRTGTFFGDVPCAKHELLVRRTKHG